jgi:hypothetical protein
MPQKENSSKKLIVYHYITFETILIITQNKAWASKPIIGKNN